MFSSALARTLSTSQRSIRLMTDLSIKQGKKFDDINSASQIPHFVQLHNLNMDEVELPLEEYKTFNQFFSRKLKLSARPVESPDDPTIAVSAADSRVMAFQDISEATTLWIKGKQFSVQNVFGPKKAELAANYIGGSMMICRLAPQDYHRWHIPVDGVLGDRTPIDGALFTVNPIAINKEVDVYTKNKRELLELKSDEFGHVVMVAVGATMVGSIHIDAPDNAVVRKGDIHGYFAFGGSTVLLFFEPGTIVFDPDLIENSRHKLETLVRVNTRIGKAIKR